MKRLGEYINKAIVASKFAPNRSDIIWRTTDGKFKESFNGNWIDSPQLSGGGDFKVFTLDVSDTNVWDAEEERPVDSVIKEIANSDYNAIRVINVPFEEGVKFNEYYYATTAVDLAPELGDANYRIFINFRDESFSEGGASTITVVTFIRYYDPDKATEIFEFSTNEIEIGGGGNEPLIVKGVLSEENAFVPDEGQPSHDDAVGAFLNGTPVLLDVVNHDAGVHQIDLVVSYDVDAEILTPHDW